MDTIRIAKFQTLIEDINTKIMENEKNLLTRSFIMQRFWNGLSNSISMSLAMIYNYDELNIYAQVIMDTADIFLYSESGDGVGTWVDRHRDKDEFRDIKARIDAAKEFVCDCRNRQNEKTRYTFIFWALMVLTVDKTNAEEHLSIICDFACMLHITVEELMDIIYVIKTIYDEVDSEYVFKSERIPQIFGGVLNLYEYEE